MVQQLCLEDLDGFFVPFGFPKGVAQPVTNRETKRLGFVLA